MPRHSKIAQLPLDLREQLNQRLINGETAASLVEWLNANPVVQAILTHQFRGLPISEQDLSNWREGGFFDWLNQRDWRAICAASVDDAAKLTATGFNAGVFLVMLTARLAVSLDRWDNNPEGPVPKNTNFHQLIATVLRIHQSELKAARLALDRDRFESERRGPGGKCKVGSEKSEAQAIIPSAPSFEAPSAKPAEKPAPQPAQPTSVAATHPVNPVSPASPASPVSPINPVHPAPEPKPFYVLPVEASALPVFPHSHSPLPSADRRTGEPSPLPSSPLSPAVHAAIASGDDRAIDAAFEAQLEADLGPDSYARFCAALGRKPFLDFPAATGRQPEAAGFPFSAGILPCNGSSKELAAAH